MPAVIVKAMIRGVEGIIVIRCGTRFVNLPTVAIRDINNRHDDLFFINAAFCSIAGGITRKRY